MYLKKQSSGKPKCSKSMIQGVVLLPPTQPLFHSRTHTTHSLTQRRDKAGNVRYTYPEKSVEDKYEIFDTLNSPSDSHAAEIVYLAHQERIETNSNDQSVKVCGKGNYVGCHASEKPPDLSLRE